jgi:hypothetical protein
MKFSYINNYYNFILLHILKKVHQYLLDVLKKFREQFFEAQW